jgi:hypothetical protein
MTGQTLTVEQFTQSVAENIAKQFDLQPSELIKSLVDRLSTKLVDALVKKQTTSPIQQKPTESKTSIVSDGTTKNVPTILNKGFETLLKFLQTPKASAISQDAKEPLSAAEPKKSLLEGKDEPKPFLFAGFTEQGFKQLEEKLPDVIKKGIKDLIDSKTNKKDKKEGSMEFPGMGIVTGALGVLSIIGGIFTLLYGLQTDGPFKGLAKLAGKGMLEIGKILTAPLKTFLSTLEDLLVKVPLEKIKIFTEFLKDVFKTGLDTVKFINKITSTILSPFVNLAGWIGGKIIDVPMKLLKTAKNSLDNVFKSAANVVTDFGSKASKTLLTPIKNIANTFGEKLLAVPMKLFKSFAGSVGGLFGKIGESSIVKTGLGKIVGFLPNMLKGLTTVLKKVPIIGTLISLSYAVSRFKSGDYLGGGIDILSGIAAIVPGIGTAVSIGLDGLNAFVDLKTGGATGKQTGAKLDLLKGMGGWIAEKIAMLPIIGPAIKAVKHFAAREWKKGLKQLAFAVPMVDAVAAFLGDEEASDTAKAFAGTFKGVNWSEIGSWLFDTLEEVPIIGPLMKAVDHFVSGDFLKGLKQLAYINPIFEAIGGLLGDNEAGVISTEIGKWGVDLVTDLSKWITDSLAEMIDLGAIKDKLIGAAKGLVSFIPGLGSSEEKAPATAKQASSPNEIPQEAPKPATRGEAAAARDAKPVTKTGDAIIKPDGGLLISSPTEGALFQLSKNDGIVAAPIAESSNMNQGSGVSFTKAETILERIAENTGHTNQGMYNLINGFNNLAKALEKAGVSLGQGTIVNNIAGQSQESPKSAQFANAGSSLIPSYRSFAETSRFVPV